MTGTEDRYIALFRLQQIMWYLFVAVFGIITILYIIGSPLAYGTALWTTVALLILTAFKLLFIGREFKREGSTGHQILTIVLLLVLLSVALLKA